MKRLTPQHLTTLLAITFFYSLSLFSQTTGNNSTDFLIYEPLETFTTKTSEYFNQDILTTMNVGDVNGDSYDDVGFHSFTSVAIYTSNDLSQYAKQISVDGMEQIYGVETLDYNGDKLSDIILYIRNWEDYTKSRFEFYNGDSEETLKYYFEINISESLSVDVSEDKFGCNRIGDINNDGIEDFILYGHSRINIYYGGTDIPVEPIQSILIGESIGTRTVATSDLNEDGTDDFVVGGAFYPDVLVYFGGTDRNDYSQADIVLSMDPSLPPIEGNLSGLGSSIATGDFNGDAVNDLAILPYLFREAEQSGDGLAALHIYFGGSEMDNQPDQLLRIPAEGYDINVANYISQFGAEMSTIPDIDKNDTDELLLGGWWVKSIDNSTSQKMHHGVIFSLYGQTEELKPLIQLKSDQSFFGGSNQYYNFDSHSAILDFNRDGKLELLARTLIKSDFSGCEIGLYDIDSSNYEPPEEAINQSNQLSLIPVNIYPNPVSNTLKLEIAGNQKFELEIYSSNGQLIEKLPIINTKSEIDLTTLRSGIYVIRIYNTEQVWIKKFIKQ